MCAQLARKDIGVAAGGNHLTTVFGMKASQCVLEIRYILNLVDKEIILGSLGKTFGNIVVELLSRYDVTELLKLLVDEYDICAGAIMLKPILEEFEHLALSYSALSDKDEHHATINQSGDFVSVLRARNQFHSRKFFHKVSQSYSEKQAKVAEITDYTRGFHQNMSVFPIITGGVLLLINNLPSSIN